MSAEGFIFDGPNKWHALELFFRARSMFHLDPTNDVTNRELLRKIAARDLATYMPHPFEQLKGKRIGRIK